MTCYTDRHPFIFMSRYWSIGRCRASLHLDCPCLQAALLTPAICTGVQHRYGPFLFLNVTAGGMKAQHLCWRWRQKKDFFFKEYCKFTFSAESHSDESMCSKTCGNFNMKWIFRLSQQGKKKEGERKLQKGFYMQQIWQHNPTMNYGNIKPNELN